MKRIVLLGIAAAGLLLAQRQTVEVVLERSENGAWRAIDPALVLDPGDTVRFRFHTTLDGYLYVIDSGTSGSETLLFPGDATGRNNRVLAGKDYVVPSTGASFKVSGPPGQDIVYWLVSPVALDGNPVGALSQKDRHPAPRLMPRCDDSIFRARGLCIDSSAGPRNLTTEEPLPAIPNLTKRELVIVQNQNRSRISAPDFRGGGPVIYEFRLAHR